MYEFELVEANILSLKDKLSSQRADIPMFSLLTGNRATIKSYFRK
jgi:hypothetical protein